MTETSYPFAPATPGDTTDPGVIATDDRWRRMARYYVGSGVHIDPLGTLAVTPATDALAVDVGPGSAHVEGFYYENNATLRLTPDPAGATARIDRAVLRLTLSSTGVGRVRAQIIKGPASGAVPPLVQTATVYDAELATFPIPAGAGRIPAFTLDPGRYARPAGRNNPGVSSVLPSVQQVPRVAGETCWLATASGRWLQFVWDDGTTRAGWKVAPGQVIYDGRFWDGGGKHYEGPWWRIGEARDGIPVGSDSTFTWTRYACLPGHGYEVSYRVTPYTAGGNLHDIVRSTLFSYTPSLGPIGDPASMVTHGVGSSSYNDTVSDSQYFDQAASELGGAGNDPRSLTWCLAGNSGSGYVQFWQGRITIKSV